MKLAGLVPAARRGQDCERLEQQEWKMKALLNRTSSFIRNEEGVTAIEYGLIASLIAVVIIAAVGLVGTNLTAVFNYVAGKLNT
jgi:pilus assembly protein Flp/PilA